jgi:hypothetical protein
MKTHNIQSVNEQNGLPLLFPTGKRRVLFAVVLYFCVSVFLYLKNFFSCKGILALKKVVFFPKLNKAEMKENLVSSEDKKVGLRMSIFSVFSEENDNFISSYSSDLLSVPFMRVRVLWGSIWLCHYLDEIRLKNILFLFSNFSSIFLFQFTGICLGKYVSI